jgi:hypothetical protein
MVLPVGSSLEHKYKLPIYRVTEIIPRISVRLEFPVVQSPVTRFERFQGVSKGFLKFFRRLACSIRIV